MTRRKAKYIVSQDEDSLVLFKKDPHYHVKQNPREKSRHPHESYIFSDEDGSSTMINWTFTNKKSADSTYKRMKKRR